MLLGTIPARDAPPLIVLGLAHDVIGSATFHPVIAGHLAGALPTRGRYPAISIAHPYRGALAGGLTPIVGTAQAGVSFLCVTAISGRRSRRRGFPDG